MVAIIKRESSSLGMPSTNSWSPKLNIDLPANFWVASIVLCLATSSDSSFQMTPQETVAMDGIIRTSIDTLIRWKIGKWGEFENIYKKIFPQTTPMIWGIKTRWIKLVLMVHGGEEYLQKVRTAMFMSVTIQYECV
jgi:hypothetical protein